MKKTMLLMLLLLATACAPDPRREAEAFATRTEAEQIALNQEQVRQHAEQMNAIAEEEARIALEHKAATAEEWRRGMNNFIRVMSFLLLVEAGVFLFYGTKTAVQSVHILSTGLAKAAARSAMVKANLIYLDPQTRQYPMLLQYLGKGRYSLANGNTDDVMMLDTRSEPDRQMITTSGLTQVAGAIAQEAAKSSDPTGIAMMHPPVVNARDEIVTVGGDT